MTQSNHRVSVMFRCAAGHDHQLCVALPRGVPPELRCEPAAPSGYGGSGGVCRTPADLDGRVLRELRDNLQASKRQGFVLIRE